MCTFCRRSVVTVACTRLFHDDDFAASVLGSCMTLNELLDLFLHLDHGIISGADVGEMLEFVEGRSCVVMCGMLAA